MDKGQNKRTLRRLGGRAVARALFASMMAFSKIGGELEFFSREPKSKESKTYKRTWSSPHQGKKEKARRVRQMEQGTLNR